MFLGLALVVLLLWAVGAFAFHVVRGMIHVLLVIAAIAVVIHFVRGRGVQA
jgi:Family of unknown function (DUF5670)